MTQTEMKLKENQFSVWPVKTESKMMSCMLRDGQNQYLGCYKRYTDAWPVPNLKVHWSHQEMNFSLNFSRIGFH